MSKQAQPQPNTKRYFSISPQNDSKVLGNASYTSGGFVYENGQDVMRFILPAVQNAMIDPNKLRLRFQYALYDKSSSNNLLNSITNIDNVNSDGATCTLAGFSVLDPMAGTHSFIDSVEIQSRKNNVVLTKINDYSKTAVIKLTSTNDWHDYGRVLLNQSMATGQTSRQLSKRINVIANGTNPVINGNVLEYKGTGWSTSLKLDVDMLMSGQPLIIDPKFLGGQNMNIKLNPVTKIISQLYNLLSAEIQAQVDLSDVGILVKNPRLEGCYYIYGQTPPFNPDIVMKSYIKLMNDVSSSYASINQTPQSSSVINVLNYFQYDDQPNNKLYTESNFRYPPNLKEVIMNKNNIRGPIDFPIKIQPNQEDYSLTASQLSNVFPKVSIQNDAELYRHTNLTMNGGQMDAHNGYNLRIKELNLEQQYSRESAPSSNAAVGLENVYPVIQIIPTDYSMNIGQVSNFVGQDYGLNIDSETGAGDTSVPSVYRSKSLIMNSTFNNVKVLDQTKSQIM